MIEVTLDQVHAALALAPFDALDAQRRMAPQPRTLYRNPDRAGSPRQAAVLILLFPSDDGLSFVLTRRAEHPQDVHSGQISLPGGSQEVSETIIQTALRETHEELGIDPSPIRIMGTLTALYIPPSDFDVHPVVGYTESRPLWYPDPVEIAEAIECPVSWILDNTKKVVEDWDINGLQLRVPWYDVHRHHVWGATAIILSEFEQRLRHIVTPRLAPEN
jgi:8-oxo-dGTP pyrophosphatase MutT (NUDIX family)